MRKLLTVLAVLFNIFTLSAQIEWNDSTSTPWGGDTDVTISPSTPTGKVTYINLSATELSLAGGSSIQLTATVNPDAAIKTVAWNVMDNGIATVSNNGIVTALKKGNTIVTATATDGTGITAQCLVTVTSDINPDIDNSDTTHGLLGDANDDGKVNIIDVNLLIGKILGTVTSGCIEENMDMDKDGKFNVADLNLMIGIILSDDDQSL